MPTFVFPVDDMQPGRTPRTIGLAQVGVFIRPYCAQRPVSDGEDFLRWTDQQKFLRIARSHKEVLAKYGGGRDQFMRAVDGAYFGDSPDQEVARDNVPLHERFGIALQSPGGRGVGEHPDPVGAINAQGNAVMELAFSSFHRIGMAGHRQAGPCVISVTEAKVGTSMASLAAHSLLGPHPETYLWLMNNLDPNGEPRPGQLLKVAD